MIRKTLYLKGIDRMNSLNSILSSIESQNLTDHQKEKLKFYTQLVLQDQNQFYSTIELKKWVDDLREKTTIRLKNKPVNQLRKWKIDPVNGEIYHESGEFFRIVGVEIENTQREVQGWDQPIVFQKEMGVLGIIRCSFNGVYHYLLNAKVEPGNTYLYQISPTLQATYSNLKKAHGGRRPKFAEFFDDSSSAKIVYKHWLAEDGGRFLAKSNLNILIEVDHSELPELPHDYRWFTLSQIKELLLFDNYINPHVRSILCHL